MSLLGTLGNVKLALIFIEAWSIRLMAFTSLLWGFFLLVAVLGRSSSIFRPARAGVADVQSSPTNSVYRRRLGSSNRTFPSGLLQNDGRSLGNNSTSGNVRCILLMHSSSLHLDRGLLDKRSLQSCLPPPVCVNAPPRARSIHPDRNTRTPFRMSGK